MDVVPIDPSDVHLKDGGAFVNGVHFKRFENELAAGHFVSFCVKRGTGWGLVSRMALLFDMAAATITDERIERKYQLDLIWLWPERRHFILKTICSLGFHALNSEWPKKPERTGTHQWGSVSELDEGLGGLVDSGFLAVERVHGEVFYTPLPAFLDRIRPLN